MKTFYLLLIVLLPTLLMAQIARFNEPIANKTYTEYISKAGDTIRVGDSLIAGNASGDFGFTFITQGGQRMHPSHAGKQFVISSIRGVGTKKLGYKLFMQFKGFGLVPVMLDYENALASGELINPHAKPTREQAIAKLKEAKDLFDLQMISQTKYDSIRSKLGPIIRK